MSPAPLAPDAQQPEQTGRTLAADLEHLSPGAVLCWYRVPDAVLAHVVARELGVDVCYAIEQQGILTLEGDLPSDAPIVLVGDNLAGANDLAGLRGLVLGAGAVPAASATRTGGVTVTPTDPEDGHGRRDL